MQCLRRGVVEAAGGRGASRSLSSSGGEGSGETQVKSKTGVLMLNFISSCAINSLNCNFKAQVKPETGVLMLNMGGPRNSEEVHEFLGNLFADKDIIKLPVQHKV